MSRRRVQLVILCEDRQHSAFARRFAEASGWDKRQIPVILSPKGRGSGEQWVREQYASEVRKLRCAPHVARALVTVIDEDMSGAGCRDAQLAKALEEVGLPARKADQAVLLIIPARNIETWLAYLTGVEVDETKTVSEARPGTRLPPHGRDAQVHFLGLQELVSHSAFMGGIGIPAIVLIGLALIPYLDRETQGTGEWFGGPGGLTLVLRSPVFGLAAVLVVEAIAIRFGWIREWYPGVPQIVITLINPGTILTALYAGWSLWVMRRHDSTRAGALALFTCLVCGFLVLTVIGEHFRGPNWDFFWSPAFWPAH